MKSQPILKLCLLCMMIISLAYANGSDDLTQKLGTSLQHWTDSIPPEKVYLHLDKPYYALGDTIWFKGYVTIGSRHQLSALSGALYVDLITERDSIIRSLKLPVTTGMVVGNFIIDDDVPNGNYRIRSYTRWMRNAGEEFFFDKAITIGNPALSKKTAQPNGKADVQFFPESGNLVNGIRSKVAFKAIAANGLGVTVKGKVTDGSGAEVAQIQSQHAGMGSFFIRPEAGKTYTAQIIYEDGNTANVVLPKSNDAGYVLGVYQPNKDSILVRVMASQGLIQSELNLVAQVSDEVVFSSTVKLTGPTNSIWLDKKSFPSGIAQFTIYNMKGEPLNERVTFIRSDDQMQLKLESAKPSYKSREPVKIDLQAQDAQGKPTFGNFSVTVIDESKIPADENNETTILSHLLLTSGLKGYVEQPSYYFNKQTDEVDNALDNLMLTQGYRRFVWKEKANAAAVTKPTYAIEGLGVDVSGQVQTLNRKPVPNASVILTSLKAGLTKIAKADSMGRFKFGGIFMTDSIKFTLQARGAKNTDRVKVILDSLPKAGVGLNKNKPQFESNSNYISNLIKQGGKPAQALTVIHYLKQVDIKTSRTLTDKDITPQGIFRIPEGSADQTVTLPEAADCSNLSMCLRGKLQGINIQSDLGYTIIRDMRPSTQGEPTLSLILDGRKVTNPDEISEILEGSILPTDVAKVMVVRSNQAIKNMLGGAALMIITRAGTARKVTYNPSVATTSPRGFNKVREFYSPRYNRPGANKTPDLRTTIYWNPYVKTDVNGKTSFNYYNADGHGTYKVIVEGINADGELGRQVLRYTVIEGQTASNTSTATGDKNLAMITAPLDSLNARMPVEKVYLHLDKPYYSVGDTLWFKAYLLDKVNLTASKISGLLYVELDTDSSEVVRRISIPIKDGVGWGQIPLAKAIFREGSYTLRAYTNWMQNFGEDYVFSQKLYIGTPSKDTWLVNSTAKIAEVAGKNQMQAAIKITRLDDISSPLALKKVQVKIFDEWHYIYNEEIQTGIDGSIKLSQVIKDKADATRLRVQVTSLEKDTYGKVIQIPLTINRDQKIDLQFLPEGGKLVNGLRSIVSFKALSEDGKGMAAEGGIFDNKGNKVVSFSTLHNGMGSFEFTPKVGEKYIAKVLQPVTKAVALPQIYAAGTVMRITNPQDGENLNITLAGLDKLSTDSAEYLIGTARGVVYYSQKVEPNQSVIAVAKRLFPTGIARFTLFKGKTPLNERAVFIDNKDQLNIIINPNKTNYNKRDSVGLEIEVKDRSGFPVKGSFALAVTDDTQIRPDSIGNFSMATSLFLNSDLKGFIENPGYYLNREDKQAWQALDNLLLTQGWTGYDWKDVFAPIKAQPKFVPEKEFKITGIVTNLAKKPVANAEVLISSKKPSFVTTTKTDLNGRYTFKNLPSIDSGSFFIQANNDKGKARAFGNISVDKFKALPVPEVGAAKALPWYINPDTTQIKYIKQRIARAEGNLKLTGNVLKEVKIRSKKVIPGSFNRNGDDRVDLAFDEEDIKESAVLNLYQLLKQKLPGLKVIDVRGMPTLMFNKYLVVIHVDGGGLPIQLTNNQTVDELEDELSKFQIAQFKGMEVMYSERNMVNYLQPRGEWIRANFSADQIDVSENLLKGNDTDRRPRRPNDPEKIYGSWYYKSGFKPGYLENRANVLTNNPPDIATVEITTKTGNGWSVNQAPSAVTYRPLPVMSPLEFYNPKYNVTSSVTEPDYRSTIFWAPNITTDHNGKAKVSFYISDIEGKYTVKVTGFDPGGWIGDAATKISTNSVTIK